MISGLEKVNSRRFWFVPDFAVWGQPSLGNYDYLALEQVDATQSILYGEASIGQSDQEVTFASLVDHRGNALPDTLASARVLVRSKGTDQAFLVGREASDRFKIARDPQAEGPVMVDLLVIELGD